MRGSASIGLRESQLPRTRSWSKSPMLTDCRYTIPPPATADDTPFPYTLCETTCPISDGMIYESETGENFRMSCAKRHGLKVLWTQSTETFDDCMDLCGKVVVSFDVSTETLRY